MRSGERTFLHLEGFGIAPGEPLEILFERLTAPRDLPRLAVLGFALLAATGAIAFLMAPLRAGHGTAAATPSATSQLAEERNAIYAALRDLDDDLDTGKLTEGDHTQLRGELRARAVQLLREERDAARAAPAPASAPGCPGCGESLPDGARFCPHCGTRLAAEAGAG